jgi:hypothetical protein
MPIGRFWEEREIDILKENYGKLTCEEIRKKFLLNRTYASIKTKVTELNLTISKRWQDWENNFLKQNYGKIPVLEICKVLNRSYAGISQRARKLRLYTKLWIFDRIGKPLSKKHKRKISIAHKKLWKQTEYSNKKLKFLRSKKWRKILSQRQKKAWLNPSSKLHSKEYKEKQSLAGKKRWQNPKYVSKVLSNISPNKSEKKIIEIIQKNKLNILFNGGKNGKTICGKVPDFVDWKQKKILELFSDFHIKGCFSNKHNSPDYFSPILRKKLFAKEGYKTLIIFLIDLNKSPLKIKKRILNFFKS